MYIYLYGGDCLYIALGSQLLHQLIADDKSTSLKNNNIVGARTKLLLPSAIVEIDERRRRKKQDKFSFSLFSRRRRQNYSIYYIYYIYYIYCLLMGVRLFFSMGEQTAATQMFRVQKF